MLVDDLKGIFISSKETAERNIQNKIKILETWLAEGVPWECNAQNRQYCDDNGHRIRVHYPDSLRSFNKWSSACYSNETLGTLGYLAPILSNGTDTLNKYPHLKTRVIDLIDGLKEVLKQQSLISTENRISELELEIARLNLFIRNQNIKIIEFQKENIFLSRELSTTERREKGNFDELHDNYLTLERQNTKLREEISLLTKQLKNIHSLRDFSRDK